MRRTLLFDLDGTLTDPKEGITQCIQFALEKCGRTAVSADELLWCIGPPILESFQLMLGDLGPGSAEEALKFYRLRYGELGLFENILYPGVFEMLNNLSSFGFQLMIATSKPTEFAEKILDHFGISRFFSAIYGCEMDGSRSDKGELIQHLLQAANLCPSQVTMIGDRKYDIMGAKKNNLASVGVTYGYGSREELVAAGADQIAGSPNEVEKIFLE